MEIPLYLLILLIEWVMLVTVAAPMFFAGLIGFAIVAWSGSGNSILRSSTCPEKVKPYREGNVDLVVSIFHLLPREAG